MLKRHVIGTIYIAGSGCLNCGRQSSCFCMFVSRTACASAMRDSRRFFGRSGISTQAYGHVHIQFFGSPRLMVVNC